MSTINFDARLKGRLRFNKVKIKVDVFSNIQIYITRTKLTVLFFPFNYIFIQ